jgi:hypothetical protein
MRVSPRCRLLFSHFKWAMVWKMGDLLVRSLRPGTGHGHGMAWHGMAGTGMTGLGDDGSVVTQCRQMMGRGGKRKETRKGCVGRCRWIGVCEGLGREF